MVEALSGISKSIQTLDNRTISYQVPYVTPDTVKILPREGMLNRKKQCKGDLKIKFKISFPENLSSEKRTKICYIINS